MSSTVAEIAAALRAETEAVACALLGQPTRHLSNRSQIRFGSRGSMSVAIAGPKAGLWFDFEAQEGGDMLTLAEREMGGKEAGRAWARGYLGLSDDMPAAAPKIKPPKVDAKAEAVAERKASKVSGIVARLQLITGTPAENYLKNRGIEATDWPVSLGWQSPTWGGMTDGEHVSGGALVVVATDAQGQPQAVQQVHVTPDGAKAPKALVGGVIKRTTGVLAGASVRLPGTGPVILAEGPETALSVWVATGRETRACLGVSNFAKQTIAPGETVIIARDHDKPDSSADRTIDKAAAALTEMGVHVLIACPPVEGEDFNDLLQHGGTEVVRAVIDAAMPWVPAARASGAPVSLPPDPNAPTVDAVRAAVASVISNFADATIAYHGALQSHKKAAAARAAGAAPDGDGNLVGYAWPMVPHVGLVAVTGIGKSFAIRTQLIRPLRTAFPDKPVVILCPTLDLCEEAAREARSAGFAAVVIRGRTAERPDAPATLQPEDSGLMCLDPSAPDDAQHAIETVQNTVCIRKDSECQHFKACPYQCQKAAARDADVIYMTYQHLFREVAEFVGTPSAVIVDESFWQAGLDTGKRKILCDQLRRLRPILGSDGSTDVVATADLSAFNGMLAKAIEACDGPLTAAALIAAGVTEEIAISAFKLWWRTKLRSGIRPGIAADDRRKRRGQVEENNKAVAKYAKAWKVVRGLLRNGEEATAWLACGLTKTGDGSKTLGAAMTYRDPIDDSWAVPTLVLDATLRPELVRPYLPSLTVRQLPYPATPYCTIRQILGAPMTSHKLSDEECRRPQDRKTARNHLQDILNHVRVRAAIHKTCLVICQMEVEKSLRKLGLPTNVEIAHFNATRGIDRWKAVDYALIIGRTLPGPQAAEALAEALTGQPVVKVNGWYPKHEGGSEYHPDPTAEACRWSICEAEIVQCIGRARGTNRTADNPVLIEVMNDTALPVPVNETVVWTAPTRTEVMTSRGVVLENNRDRAKCFPDIWKNEQAAKDDRRTVENSYIERPIKEIPTVLTTYRPIGAGQKDRIARFDILMIPDPKAWLTERLGPLAHYSQEVSRPELTIDVEGFRWFGSPSQHPGPVPESIAPKPGIDPAAWPWPRPEGTVVEMVPGIRVVRPVPPEPPRPATNEDSTIVALGPKLADLSNRLERARPVSPEPPRPTVRDYLSFVPAPPSAPPESAPVGRWEFVQAGGRDWLVWVAAPSWAAILDDVIGEDIPLHDDLVEAARRWLGFDHFNAA